MYLWEFAFGFEYLIGALATIGVFCSTEKVVTVVSLILFAAITIYFAMYAQYYFYFSHEGYWLNFRREMRETKATEVVVYTDHQIMWGLTCMVLFSVSTSSENEQKVIALVFGIITALGVAYFLFWDFMYVVLGHRGDMAPTIWDWEHYIFYVISLVAVVLLAVKQHQGRLAHLNPLCLNKATISAMLAAKIAIFGFWAVDRLVLRVNGTVDTLFLLFLLLKNAAEILWLCLVLKVALTMKLEAQRPYLNNQYQPVVQPAAYAQPAYTYQPAAYAQPVYAQPAAYAQPSVNNQSVNGSVAYGQPIGSVYTPQPQDQTQQI